MRERHPFYWPVILGLAVGAFYFGAVHLVAGCAFCFVMGLAYAIVAGGER